MTPTSAEEQNNAMVAVPLCLRTTLWPGATATRSGC
jgi:hypothetical protein